MELYSATSGSDFGRGGEEEAVRGSGFFLFFLENFEIRSRFIYEEKIENVSIFEMQGKCSKFVIFINTLFHRIFEARISLTSHETRQTNLKIFIFHTGSISSNIDRAAQLSAPAASTKGNRNRNGPRLLTSGDFSLSSPD